MSPSLVADGGNNGAALTPRDLLFAVAAHLLVVALITAAQLWRSEREPEPPERVEVQLISGDELARATKRAAGAAKPAPPEAKPAPEPKPAARPRRKAGPEEAFDPFAPLTSPTERSDESAAAEGGAAEVEIPAQLRARYEAQLTRREFARYVAMMQAAVTRHWKVPASVDGDIEDPLVEVELRPDGSVARVTILESSGNAAIDASLARAVRAAAPFTLPRAQFELFRTNRIRFHPLR